MLAVQTGHHRIYAQISYRVVREFQFPPIILAEALQLAPAFPLCWKRTPNGPTLVAVRSFLDNGLGHPGEHGRTLPLPLVLQAFPLIVPDADSLERHQFLFDSTIADNPTDVGAPLMLPDGKLSRAALGRAKIAVGLARYLDDADDFSRAVEDAGLLEPWPLHFDLGQGQRVAIDDLLVLAPNQLDDGIMFDLIKQYGIDAGVFLSLHRASLFRAGPLLAAARAAVTKPALASPSGGGH